MHEPGGPQSIYTHACVRPHEYIFDRSIGAPYMHIYARRLAYQLAVGGLDTPWWGHLPPPMLGLKLHPDGPAPDDSVVAIDVAVWSGFVAATVVIVVVAAARRGPGLPAPTTVGTAEEATTMSSRTATAVAVVPAGRLSTYTLLAMILYAANWILVKLAVAERASDMSAGIWWCAWWCCGIGSYAMMCLPISLYINNGCKGSYA